MASVNSPIRKIIKPFLFKILGKTGYKFIQSIAKIRDIKLRLVEEKEMELLKYFVTKNDHVIDLGANYAYYLERLSKIVGENGKVFGFEPVPFTFEVCQMIVKKLKLKNVDLFQYAANDQNTNLQFRIPKVDFGAISAGQSHRADRNNDLKGKEDYYSFYNEEIINCEGKKIDDLLFQDLKKLSFIKIDIEGAELFALRGMIKIIKSFTPIILIEIQPFFLKGYNITETEIISYIIDELDYEIYFYDQELKKLKIINKNLWDSNYILIPKKNKKKYQHIIYEE